MDPIWADEQLRERGGSATAGELFALTLLATGDPIKADRARSKRAAEEMLRGETP